jgi:glycosyltransferase involved in cell wall biosynthesis
VAREPRVNSFRGLDTPAIKEIIDQERFDAVMVNGWHYKSAWQTMRACWKTKTPVMLRSDSHLHTQRSLAKRALKWPLYRWFIPKLDACLPVGKWSTDYFLHYGARPDRVFVVPHVVDTKYFSDKARKLSTQRAELRAQWGLQNDAVVFLFVGKFIEKKRPMDFVQALASASRDNGSISGLMVGDGPLRAECEQFARDHNVPISFAGFLNQSEIISSYVVADVLVLPSDGGETWGLVVNEAMACGLPCIVSDHVGCGPDMVISHETGEAFPLGEVKQLSKLLATTAADKKHLEQMKAASNKKAQQYSIGCAVDRLLSAASAMSDGKA